jgi:hypothetical protein
MCPITRRRAPSFPAIRSAARARRPRLLRTSPDVARSPKRRGLPRGLKLSHGGHGHTAQHKAERQGSESAATLSGGTAKRRRGDLVMTSGSYLGTVAIEPKMRLERPRSAPLRQPLSREPLGSWRLSRGAGLSAFFLAVAPIAQSVEVVAVGTARMAGMADARVTVVHVAGDIQGGCAGPSRTFVGQFAVDVRLRGRKRVRTNLNPGDVLALLQTETADLQRQPLRTTVYKPRTERRGNPALRVSGRWCNLRCMPAPLHLPLSRKPLGRTKRPRILKDPSGSYPRSSYAARSNRHPIGAHP